MCTFIANLFALKSTFRGSSLQLKFYFCQWLILLCVTSVLSSRICAAVY